MGTNSLPYATHKIACKTQERIIPSFLWHVFKFLNIILASGACYKLRSLSILAIISVKIMLDKNEESVCFVTAVFPQRLPTNVTKPLSE